MPCNFSRWADAYTPMNFVASLTNLGGPDLIVILLIILVLFGAKKLPELAKGMGSALKEFQKAGVMVAPALASASTASPRTAPSSLETSLITTPTR